MGCSALKQIKIPRPIPSTHHPLHHQPLQNAKTHLVFLMPLTNQTVRRSVSFIPIKFNHQKLFCIKNITMADQENKGTTQTLNVDSEKKEEKPSETIPLPPEKPLPGDCCGSGCVRCVWDVYYDDLEDYNKVYGSNKAKD